MQASPAARPLPVIRGELANLDTLRAFAVLAVLFNHLVLTLNYFYFRSSTAVEFASRAGRLGVIAFFVHTSLVLMFSLERIHKQSAHPVRAFYWRRAFRIYPLAIATVILVCVFRIPDAAFAPSLPGRYSSSNILLNLLLAQNIAGSPVTGPLWSLPFEVQMYAILPALFLLTRRPAAPAILGRLIALYCVLGFTCHLLTGRLHFLAFIPCFLCGILAYCLRFRVRPAFPAAAWAVFVPLMILAGSAAGVIWARQEYIVGWAVSLSLGCAVYRFHDSTNRWWNAITKNIAKYSYGLYLMHTPALWLVFNVWGLRNPYLAGPLWLAVTGAASVIAFHVLEEPMIQYGKRWAAASAPAPVAQAGAALCPAEQA